MEGPTPVSALIHAATMVTAGVYLMVRINPVLAASADWVPTMIAWVGVITALFAATIAVAQNDIKKVLAYSTVSQLGYMFLAVGSGAYVAAIFHMITHAFFKALLFLGSGSVIHGMHEQQDMRYMGVLRKFMPVTAATFIVGWLAIAGVLPLSGFWSKDEILLFSAGQEPGAVRPRALDRAPHRVLHDPPGDHGLLRQGPLGGPGRGARRPRRLQAPREPVDHAHPAGRAGRAWPSSMGIIQLPDVTWLPESITQKLEHWLEPVIEFGEADIDGTWGYDNKTILMLFATAAAVGGIIVAWLVYEKDRIKAVEPTVLANAWYYDKAVSDFMGGPGGRASRAPPGSTPTSSTGPSTASARSVRGVAGELRKGQSGYVRGYAGIIGIGVVLLLAWFVVVRGIL